MKIPILPATTNRDTVGLFCYQNTTSQIQVVRSDRSARQKLEKIVFPGERLLFRDATTSVVEVYSSTATGLTLIDRISCSQLQVLEPSI